MVCLLGSGSCSKSSSVSVTYWSLAYSYPRTVSLQGTSTSSVGHQRTCLTRVPQVLCSRRNAMSLLSGAPYSFTGMLTIPKLIEPLQIALAMGSPGETPVPHSHSHTAASYPHHAAGYPQGLQHKLLRNKNLGSSTMRRRRGMLWGMNHRLTPRRGLPCGRTRP